jgi:hypothetical protein
MHYAIRSLLAFLILASVRTLPAQDTDAADDDEKIVKVQELIDAVTSNHAAADERFAGRRLRVQGRAVFISRFRKEGEAAPLQYLLRLESEHGAQNFGGAASSSVNIVCDLKQRAGLAEIKRGDLVIVEAVCPDELQADTTKFNLQEGKLIRIFPNTSIGPPGTRPGEITPDLPTAPTAPTPLTPAPGFPPMAVPPPRR